MAAKKMNAFYAQSGGVTAVINASACGVLETARKHKDKTENHADACARFQRGGDTVKCHRACHAVNKRRAVKQHAG